MVRQSILNSECWCAGVKMPSSLPTAATAWRKLSLDIRGSWDKRGGLLACRRSEEESDSPVKLSTASKVVLIKDYYERAGRYCQMSGLLWKYSPNMATGGRKVRMTGWSTRRRGFHLSRTQYLCQRWSKGAAEYICHWWLGNTGI